MTKYLFILAAALVWCAACETCEVGEDGGCAVSPATDSDTAVDHEVTDQDTSSPYQTAISSCGGFGAAPASVKGSYDTITETLDWEYDVDAGLVTITDYNVCINCCGDHRIETNAVDGGFEVTEVDVPEEGRTRCKCDCNFDFRITLPVPDGADLKLDLSRDVKESGIAPIWNGTLHLSDQSGSIVIRSDFTCI